MIGTTPPEFPFKPPQLDGKGHIVLVHDGGGDRSATIEMLKTFIPQAKAQGYTFTTVAAACCHPNTFPRPMSRATVADNATLAALTTYLVTPNVVLTWLFWFGIASLTILTFLYVVLALINNHRQKKRLLVRRQ